MRSPYLRSLVWSFALLGVLLAVHHHFHGQHAAFPALLSPKNVLLLTAHPDDEVMFFAPTVISTSVTQGITLWALVLSAGNADGLGEVRKREAKESFEVLGVQPERVTVLDHPQLQDDITSTWDAATIAEVIRPYFEKHHIDMILTFDSLGVSRHPNHISLPLGVSHLLCDPTVQPTATIYSLKTTTLSLKYTGLLSLLFPFRTEYFRVVSGARQYTQALRAMMKHWSQLVWFRWLYISFSRYMWINEWEHVVLSC